MHKSSSLFGSKRNIQNRTWPLSEIGQLAAGGYAREEEGEDGKEGDEGDEGGIAKREQRLHR